MFPVSSVARVLAVVALLSLSACRHDPPVPAVQVPPRVVLTEWPVIGVVEFRGDRGRVEQARFATRHFVEMLHAAQPGARILELGSETRVLAELGRSEMDFETVRALGKRYKIDAVFTGELTISEPKPRVAVGQFWNSVEAAASVRGELTARLFETASGASMWSRVSESSAEVAGLRLAEGLPPNIGAVDPDDATTVVVRRLVDAQSGDFYPTWVQP